MNIKIITFICALFAAIAGVFIAQFLSYDFKTLEGNKIKHNELSEQVVIVNYFAEWCAPCLREIPELNEFFHQKGANVKLFAISYDQLPHEKLKVIQEKYNIEFPLIQEIINPFPFKRPDFLPATFIIKPNGELAGQLYGEQTVQSLQEAVEAAKGP